MTYPAESAQIGYQNHVEDIRSFLDSRHADHYTVFNLSQRNYRGAKFSNRVSVMLPHEAPDEAVTELLVCTQLLVASEPFSLPELLQHQSEIWGFVCSFSGYFWSANVLSGDRRYMCS